MSTAPLGNDLRPELGDFVSIIGFRALLDGLQEALGEKAALITAISAGRARGREVAESLGLAGIARTRPSNSSHATSARYQWHQALSD